MDLDIFRWRDLLKSARVLTPELLNATLRRDVEDEVLRFVMVVLGCKLRARTLNPKPYYPKTRNPTTRLCASLGYKYV